MSKTDNSLYSVASGPSIPGHITNDPEYPVQTRIVNLSDSRGGGNSISVSIPVTAEGSYDVGISVGGLITFDYAVRHNAGLSLITSLKLIGINAATPYQLLLFNANIENPANDLDSIQLDPLDYLRFLGYIPIAETDYQADANGVYFATVRVVGLMVKSIVGSSSLYGYLMATSEGSPGVDTIVLTVDFEYLD